ncbi:MAG: TlpA disulfide reductase family protein [Candidatus Sumerlaeales bacterium]|nr:TlpA disulfide reductase family protein [Candidatus Sumerlaeales bacterium]
MYNTKLLSPFLTIVLCASLFTACDKPQKPEDNTTPAVKPAPAEGLTTAEKPITTESLATADIPMTEDEVAPPLEAQDIFSGKKVTLKDFQGQVVFLDFWTSWCPPCQEPMRHNQKLMTKHAEDWKGKAAIIGVSLDDLVGTIQKHVSDKNLTAPLQLWAEGGWNSKSAQDYKVRGVPSAFLINKKGSIVWSGHPATVDVEKMIAEEISK